MRFRIVSLVLLSLGTAVFSVGYSQYEIIGKNLLQNPLFHDNFLAWQVLKQGSISVHDGVATLSNTGKNNHASVSAAQTVVVPSGQRLLFLSCEARALDVVPGGKPWETARVVIFPLTADNQPRYDVPHTLALLHGTTSWERFEHIFRVPEENTSVSVVVQLLNASGTLEVRSVSLRSAIENPFYQKWRHALMLAWFIVGLWIVWPLLRTARRGMGRIGMLVTSSIILVGVLMPASVKYGITPSWLLPTSEAPGPFRADLLQDSVPFSFELLPTELNIYKLAHFLLFALMGYLLISRRSYGTPIWVQVGIIGLFALATESMQVLTSGRDGRLSDVLIDLSGVCCGMLAATVMRRCYDLKPTSSKGRRP